MMLRRLAVPSFLLLFACSSSSHSDASGSGTLAGVSFTASAGVVTGPVAAGQICESAPDGGASCASTGQEALTVTFTNNAAFGCGDRANNFANLSTLVVTVTQSGSIGAGTYPIGTGATGASATFSTTTAACGSGQIMEATGGSITVTKLEGNQVSGTVSLMFGSDPFTGTFDVPSCTNLDGGPPLDAGFPVSVTSCMQ